MRVRYHSLLVFLGGEAVLSGEHDDDDDDGKQPWPPPGGSSSDGGLLHHHQCSESWFERKEGVGSNFMTLNNAGWCATR